MSKSKIEWTDKVWNPVSGCTKVSPGCDHCYTERMATRLAGRCGYPADKPFKVTLHEERLEEPLRWTKPWKVFVCSMADLFHPDVPEEYIAQVWWTMRCAGKHTFMILTKRPERMAEIIPGLMIPQDKQTGTPTRFGLLPNVWLGVTAENQEMADRRIPILLKVPAAARFVSVEPMLGTVDLTRIGGDKFGWGRIDALNGLRYIRANATESGCEWKTTSHGKLDWVICGGESGPKARPMHPDWVGSLRVRCQAAEVPFFFKQWGEWTSLNVSEEKPGIQRLNMAEGCGFHGERVVRRVGKKVAGRLLDGQEWNEMPRA